MTNNPSGEPIPIGDLPGWRQIFTDDFETPVALGQFPSAVADRWWAYRDSVPDTPGSGQYWPSKVVSIHDGMLDKWIRTENGTHLIAAILPKLAPGPRPWGVGLSSGRYAIRFKSDSLPRYKTAFLLWPDSGPTGWPRDGEIDFPEGELSGVIKAFMHRQGATSGSDQAAFPTTVTYADWHTARIEWKAGVFCRFYLDDVLVGAVTERVPNTPMHWVIQTQTELRNPDPVESTQGHLYIDWVAVWVPMTPEEQEKYEFSQKLDAALEESRSLTLKAGELAYQAALLQVQLEALK